MSSSPLSIENLVRLIRRYLLLQVDNVRLTVTQRLALLFTGVAYVAVIFVLAVWLMFFAAIAVAHFLGQVMSMGWAYLIVASIYVVCIAVCVVFKKQLFLNPIARFLSRLLLASPSHEEVTVTEEVSIKSSSDEN